MDSMINFNSLLIICLLAFLLPLIINEIKVLRIPVVIAEIAAGIIVGKSGLKLIGNDAWLEFLSLFGFAYLMFLSGVEIDFSYLKRVRKDTGKDFSPMYIGLFIFLSTVLLSFLLSIILVWFKLSTNPFFLTLIFSTTSLGIVVPTLKEKRILNELIGQAILIAALIADFATMLMIPLVMYISAGTGSLDLIYSLLIFVVFAVSYYTGKKFLRISFIDNPTFETSQLKVRAAFALVLLFVTISQIVNVEIILGAFLAGVLFSLLFDKFRTELAPKLDAIGYGFLIPIFFIMIGVRFDLGSILDPKALISLPVFIVIVYAVKLIPTLVLKKHFSLRETLAAGLLLSSRLSLIIAVSLVALKTGVISQSVHSSFVLVAIVTSMVSPVLFLKLFPERKQQKECIFIVGNSQLIVPLATKTDTNEKDLIIADTSFDTLDKLNELNIKYEYKDSFSSNSFDQMINNRLSTFIAAYENNIKNIRACEAASTIGIPNIAALIDDPRHSNELEKQGIKTITPHKAMLTLLHGITKFPESFDLLYNIENNFIETREFVLISQRIIGSRLKRLRLPGDCLILLVIRNGKRIVPDGNTLLEKGDVIVIIGNKDYIQNVSDFLN